MSSESQLCCFSLVPVWFFIRTRWMISSSDLSFQAMLFDSLEIVKQRKSQASRLRDRVPLDLVIRGFIVKGLVPAPLRGPGYSCIHPLLCSTCSQALAT